MSAIPQPFDAPSGPPRCRTPTPWRSRYVVHPFFGINFGTGEVVRDRATWVAFARDLNRAGRMAREVGLRLGYHNHNWEFFRLTDDPSQDGVRHLDRGDGPTLRALRAGPVLGHPRGA